MYLVPGHPFPLFAHPYFTPGSCHCSKPVVCFLGCGEAGHRGWEGSEGEAQLRNVWVTLRQMELECVWHVSLMPVQGNDRQLPDRQASSQQVTVNGISLNTRQFPLWVTFQLEWVIFYFLFSPSWLDDLEGKVGGNKFFSDDAGSDDT